MFARSMVVQHRIPKTKMYPCFNCEHFLALIKARPIYINILERPKQNQEMKFKIDIG